MAKTKEEYRESVVVQVNKIIVDALVDCCAAAGADCDKLLEERDEANEDCKQAVEQIVSLTNTLTEALADRDAAIQERDELRVQLRNAREAHSIAEQKVDEMLHPKVEAKPAEAPAEVAEVEGPFSVGPWDAIKESGVGLPWGSGHTKRYVRLLNLGVKSEAMQKRIEELERSLESEREASADIGEAFQAAKADCMETLKSYNEANARADAAEAREKALRERCEEYAKQYRGSFPATVISNILADAKPNQPADQAPEATKP